MERVLQVLGSTSRASRFLKLSLEMNGPFHLFLVIHIVRRKRKLDQFAVKYLRVTIVVYGLLRTCLFQSVLDGEIFADMKVM